MSQAIAVDATEYPFSSNFHTVEGGHKLHYVDEGTGELVVMVHGNPTWSFYFRNLIKRLRDRYRVIALDHIGCGLSDKPGDEDYAYTLSRRVEDLGSLIKSVAPEGAITLVVHDWGGMIGMAWAVQNPERIKKLVLLNTAAFPLPESKPFPFPLWLARNTRVGSVLVERFNAFSRVASRVCVTEKMAPQVKAGFEAPYVAPENRLATLRFVQDIPLKPEDQAYKIVADTEGRLNIFADRPILIGWGHKDFVFDKHFLARWKEIYPGAEYVEYPEAGHYVLEDRRDDLIERIDAFLRKEKESEPVSGKEAI